MTAYTAIVTVRLKRGVLDPEAETTQQALERLGFELRGLRSAEFESQLFECLLCGFGLGVQHAPLEPDRDDGRVGSHT